VSDHINTTGKATKIWWKRWWAIALGILVVLSVVGALAPSDDKQEATPSTTTSPAATTVTVAAPVQTAAIQVTETTQTAPPSESEPTTTEAAAPAEKPSFGGDGQYVVREDIEPGTYRTREGSDGCYWARLKGFGGNLDEIVANTNTSAPTVVTISRRDKGFEASGCGTFTKDLSRITESKTRFGDGTFIVGVDIAPGRYRSSGGDGCYLARLRGFGGTLGEIISNGNPSGRAVVTILGSDRGFQSDGCGTWKRS
jgi:hypothetical protein